MLSEEQVRSFRHKGYLILRDVLLEPETRELQSFAQEVHDWPTDEESPWMPYEVCLSAHLLATIILSVPAGNQRSRKDSALPNRELRQLP